MKPPARGDQHIGCALTFEARLTSAKPAIGPGSGANANGGGGSAATTNQLPAVKDMGAKQLRTELKERGAGTNDLIDCVELEDFRRLLHKDERSSGRQGDYGSRSGSTATSSHRHAGNQRQRAKRLVARRTMGGRSRLRSVPL